MKGTEHEPARKAGETLEALFRHASARKRPPAAVEETIREALHAEWRSATRRRKRRRTFALAAAASLFIAVLAGVLLSTQPDVTGPRPILATTDRVMGTATVKTAKDGALSRVNPAANLAAGDTVFTRGRSWLALRWRNGASLRLDQNTRIRLGTDGSLELEYGQVYVDTDIAAGRGEELVIRTPAGAVRHLGTRYIAAVSGGNTTVRVRAGRVAVGSSEHEAVAATGEQLSVDTAGTLSIDPIPIHGPLWAWAADIAPAWNSDGKTIEELLGWVNRETGLPVRFASAQARMMASQTLLHGEVNLAPMAALAAVLQTTDLEFETAEGEILVRELGPR
jgi:ferric-dicitrate binding protein FerR (iron transport regulator)